MSRPARWIELIRRHAEAIELLGKIKFFAGLPAAYLRRIADIGTEEEHNGATTIFQEGDKGDKFYLIIDGAVRISRMVPGMGEEALAVLQAGRLLRRDGAHRRLPALGARHRATRSAGCS